MVQAKHKKPTKPRKQRDGVKKEGKQSDLAQFRSQLDALGLKIVEVTGDGNCFFRALADQLEGNEEEHNKFRSMVVQYIMNHREEFQPFIEDDVPFDEYCKSMEEDGTWAGNMELQAASLVTRRNICIHHNMSPRWYIRNFDDHEASMIHLSYQDGEHYNSIRSKDDLCEGSAKLIIIKADANISAAGHHKKVSAGQLKGTVHKSVSDSGSVKLVMAGTGCTNVEKVEQVLHEVYGDVDAAIEFLIAEQQMNGSENHAGNNSSKNSIHNGDDQSGNCEQWEGASTDMTFEPNVPKVQSVQENNIQHDDKKISRNKECICGSKKKHKACCGSAERKTSMTVISNKWTSNKMKKEMRRSGKKVVPKEEDSQPVHLPDVGALCI